MKTASLLPLCAVGLVVLALPARASLAFSHQFKDVNLVIPDGNAVGVSDTRNPAFASWPIQEVQVTLEIVGGYTGDLYAQLIHNGTSAVLLNRPGKRASDPLGYADSGLNVTFSDGGANGEVHVYRLTLGGSHATPLAGPLTGTWQPDARTADPASVVDTSPRTAFLNGFVGGTPNGAWTLHVADLSPVGEATLKSWTLHVTVVPEPGEMGLGFALALLGWAAWRRGKKTSG